MVLQKRKKISITRVIEVNSPRRQFEPRELNHALAITKKVSQTIVKHFSYGFKDRTKAFTKLQLRHLSDMIIFHLFASFIPAVNDRVLRCT